jgi:hypothetical protein
VKTIARSQQDDACQQNQPQNKTGFPPAKARTPPNLYRKIMHNFKEELRNAEQVNSPGSLLESTC